MRASEGPNALLSGAKTWTRWRKIGEEKDKERGAGGSSALGAHRPLPLVSPSSLAPNEPYLNLFSLPSHAPGSSKREVINHRAINNQYFSSNVYRVRFKCLVKTNLRPYDGGLRPFCLAPSPPCPAHPCQSDEYISRPGTDVNSLPDPSRNLAFGWQGRAKVKERKWLTTHGSDTLYTPVCV